MKVKEIMTTGVIGVREDNTVEEVAGLLANHRISGLPVVNGSGTPIGMVTEFDLISKQGQTVGQVMTRGVISVSPDTEVEDVSHLLTHRRIRRVPVIDGDQLVGIVSRADLVKQIAMRWVCPTCGWGMRGPNVPEQCPGCHAHRNTFTHELMQPGM